MKKVFFIGAGPGDPDLITVKGLALLEDADVVLYTGSLVNPDLINRSRAPLKVDSHGMPLMAQIDLMEREVKADRRVVRLHSGDPSLYGAIVEQIAALAERDIGAEVIPGVSSLFGAAAALRTQLTLSGVSDTLIVTRPAGKTLKSDMLPELSRLGTTMAIFLGTERLGEVLSRLECAPGTPAAVVYHASWEDQKIVRGTVEDIAEKAREAGIVRTALLLVGGVVDPETSGFRRSVLYS
ncbi:MAG: SAM-dependent methyltransferase [Methanoregulaceae archaeon]|nr:SAM-dependent methyltransferase [Methanoregulaceae archaeon]